LATILLSRPLDDNREALLSILHDTKVGAVWRAAGNLLAANPTPEFVIGLLDDFSVFTRVLIFEPGTGGGMSYGDCFSPEASSSHARVPEDWPPLSVYKLELGKRTDALVSFTSMPAVDSSPWTGISHCGADIQGLRRDLILQLSGVDSSKAPLKAVVLDNVVRETDDQLRRDVIRILREQAQSFTEIVLQLQMKGLITPSQVKERHLHMQVFVIPSGSLRALPDLPDLRLLGILGEYRKQ